MPFGGLLSLAGPAVSLGAGLFGLSQGTPASNVPTYNYKSMGGADAGAISGTGALGGYNIGANLLPQYQQTASSMLYGNNPYAQGYQAGTGPIGAATTGAGAQLTGASSGLLGDVGSLINMGFDPQGALYNYTQNLNQQQNLAALSQSGLGTTPYGQGVNAMANNQFNMNWENNQLGRATQAAGAAGGLVGAAGGGMNTGTGLMAAGNAMPYNANATINSNALAALGGAGQFGNTVSQIPQTQIQDYLAYLSGGTSQQGANTSTANSTFAQNQILGSQIGNSLSGLGNAWGKAFGGGGGWGNSGVGNYGQNTNIGIGNYTMPMFT